MTPEERRRAEDRLQKLKRLRELKAQRADLVDEGGMSSMPSVRDAVESAPSWLTRTSEEKQQNQMRLDANQQDFFDEMNAIPRGMFGPSWEDRAQERDLILAEEGKTMTAPEAGLVRTVNSALLTLPQHLDVDLNQDVGVAGNEHPVTSAVGDVLGFFAPGTALFKTGEKAVRGIGNAFAPGLRASTGSNTASRLSRYAPNVAAGTVAGLADYTVFEGTVGAGTRAAEEGRQPTIDDMASAAMEAPTDPWAYLGGLASPVYRAGRAVAGVATGGRVTMTPPQRAQWAETVMQRGDPRSKAFQMIAKRLERDGITPEMLTKAVENYYYAGYSTVDEMLFEVAEAAADDKGAGQLKQLAVALGAVGGDAQAAARSNFSERRLGSLDRLRTDLRKAAGLEGSNFYNYADQLREAERTLPDYSQPYGQSITDDSWTQSIWPDFQARPASQKAIIEAYDYARNIGQLEVASEIGNLLPAIGYKIDNTGNVVKIRAGKAGDAELARARSIVPKKPSTQALDYIDRMLGDQAQSLRSATTGRRELARGPSEAQTRLRSIVDTETGLDQPRRIVHELKTAQNALDFGKKSAASGTDLETLQREFLREMQKYASEGSQVLGEETATINAALLMGWLRGAEDTISKASNPGTAIRQLYGTPRQREKMIEMLMGLDQTRLAQQAGQKSDGVARVSTGNSPETKRLRQLAGGKYNERGTPRSRGRFDRERRMLDSEAQIVLNSQTGQRNEAVAAQGGLQRQISAITEALLNPQEAMRSVVRNTVGRLTRPGLFNPDINRELGEIMFTGGRDNLRSTIGELEQYMRPQNAFSSQPTASSARTAENAFSASDDPLESQRGAIGGRSRRDVMRDASQGNFPAERSQLPQIRPDGYIEDVPGNEAFNRLDQPSRRRHMDHIRQLNDTAQQQEYMARIAELENANAFQMAQIDGFMGQQSELPANAFSAERRSMMDGPLPILGGLAAGATGATIVANEYLNRPKASSRALDPVSLPDIREELVNDYAKVLTNINAREGVTSHRLARVQQIDRLIQREQRLADRQPGPPALEQARQEIIELLIHRIKNAPESDLEKYYKKLDQIDDLIMTGGVPAPRPAGVPPTPSLKPELPLQ